MSNYEKMQNQMASVFLAYDQDAMIRRFGLKADKEALIFDFLGGGCRIDRSTGAVLCKTAADRDFRTADYNEAMTVYDLLCYAKPGAIPSGRMMNMASLCKRYGALPGRQPSFFKPEAKRFDAETDRLAAALAALGAAVNVSGEIKAEIPVLDTLVMRFHFCPSDEEFPPEIQFFWDEAVPDFMHYETVWFANHALIRRLTDLMHRGI